MQSFISTVNLAGNYNTHGPGEGQTISNSDLSALFLCIENHCFLSVEIEAVQLKERCHKMCFMSVYLLNTFKISFSLIAR